MMTRVDFSIWHSGANKEKAKFNNAICFQPLYNYYKDMNEYSYVLFYVKTICNFQEVSWYADGLNTIGLNCSFSERDNSYNFLVYKISTYCKMLATLTAIRYLQEVDYPKMIQWGYEQAQKNPELDFFSIFQLMHFTIGGGIHTGHGFIGGFSPYGGCYKLNSLNTFVQSLETSSKVNETLANTKHSLSKEEKEELKLFLKDKNYIKARDLLLLKPVLEV